MLPAQEQAIAAADAVCETDPVLAAVRDELLRIVDLMDRPEGWNVHDIKAHQLFQLAVAPNLAPIRAGSATMPTLTALVRGLAMAENTSTSEALKNIAFALAHPETLPDVEGLIGAKEVLGELEAAQDCYVYGFGYCGVALGVRADAPDPQAIIRDSAREMSAGINPDETDDLRATLFVHLVDLNGRQWSVLKQRGRSVVYATAGPDEPASGLCAVGDCQSLAQLGLAYAENVLHA